MERGGGETCVSMDAEASAKVKIKTFHHCH